MKVKDFLSEVCKDHFKLIVETLSKERAEKVFGSDEKALKDSYEDAILEMLNIGTRDTESWVTLLLHEGEPVSIIQDPTFEPRSLYFHKWEEVLNSRISIGEDLKNIGGAITIIKDLTFYAFSNEESQKGWSKLKKEISCR